MLNWRSKTKQSISHRALNDIPCCRFGSRPHVSFHLPAVPRKLPTSRSPKLSLTILAEVVWISSVPAKPLSEIVLNSFNSGVVTDMNRTVAPASSFNGDLSKWDVTRSLTWIPWAESWADGYHDDGMLQCCSPLPPEARGRGAVGWYAVGWLVGTGPPPQTCLEVGLHSSVLSPFLVS